MAETLEWLDYITIAIYLVVVLVVGLWSTFRPNKNSTSGYFLAGRSMHWLPVGSSIFASNVGSPMFVGLAGTAAASGFAVAIYEWSAVYHLIALGWLFVPVYIACGMFTIPEYLTLRFGGRRLRVYISVLAMTLYAFGKISNEVYAGALFLQHILGWNIYISTLLILAVTAVYTIAGGLTAVIYTDTLQTVILLIGSSVLSVLALNRVGGWESMLRGYSDAMANYTRENKTFYACGVPRTDSFNILRDPVTGDIPWTGSLTGLTIMGLWVWCTDQIMVQRTLSAKNLSHAKGGALLAAFLKILLFFLFIIPGMISRVLYPQEIACASPDECDAFCGNKAGCSNVAYPLLVLRILPGGLRGLMLAALLAALMSSLTSIFNSASSIFTMDIWCRIRRKAKETELMLVGRFTVVVLVAISILWIPILELSTGGQLWNIFQSISSYTAPPWVVVYIMAIFWKRTTEQGAFWGLISGLVIGTIRLVIDLTYPAPYCGSGDQDNRPAILRSVHFLHFAIILAILTGGVTFVVSLFTTPRPPEKLRRVTWWTRNDPLEPEVTDSEEEAPKASSPKRKTNKKSKPSAGNMFYSWLCGVSDETKSTMTTEELAIIHKNMTSIAEDPKTKRLLDIGAIIAATLVTFLIAFFY